ncbi:MAG: HAMP domain-containing histidine kinase [bacterium]|nr:HAMP domain-containing histidine kinase [bacterium]
MSVPKICVLGKETLLKKLDSGAKELRFILKAINSFTDNYIIVLDEKRKIIACSDSFFDLVKKTEIIGENFFNVAEKIIDLPNDFLSHKSYFVKEKGNMPPKIFQAKIEKYFEKFEDNGKYIIILKDVTKDSELQAQKDNFIATLTHDLKTPVRADIMSLELLLKGKFGDLSAAQTEILSEMLNSNKFMMNMLDTLLAKYKYENGGVELTKCDFDLNNFVKEVAKELKCLFEEKQIKCEFGFGEEKIKIHADKIELKRALSNLISNAIKFNKRGGFVKISTAKADDKIKITVEDNGIGMSEDKLEHIFDKYVSYAKRFRQLGTGLGLYVAKKTIEAHGGKITVVSEADKGSTFTIILPNYLTQKAN